MDEKSRKNLTKLGIIQIVKFSVILAAYEGFVVFLFFLYHNRTGAAFTDPSGIGWVILMMLPFAFNIQKKIFDASWSGRITKVNDPPEAERSSYMMKSYTPAFLTRTKDLRVVTVEVGIKKYREIVLFGDETGLGDTYYHVGDSVTKFHGLKYPVNYTTKRNEIFCPVCGRFSKTTSKRCYWCKSELTDPEREHQVDETVTG